MSVSIHEEIASAPFKLTSFGKGTDNIPEELSHAISDIYLSIVKVDLLADRACILYSMDRPENVSLLYDWTEYLSWYATLMVKMDYYAALQDFSSEKLLLRYEIGETCYSQDFAFYRKEATAWLNIQAFLRPSPQGRPYAYILIRPADEEYLLKSIINQYVYSNCDYFIYLDARNDSYTMFSGSTSGTPLPPVQCASYSTEIVKYAREFVYPEDQEHVIREMSLSRVLDVLASKPVHSIVCGVKDPVLGYTRKRLDYRYHDKVRQMVLLSRTDITDMYMAEQKKNKALHEALLRAQTDALTGLLNYHGTVDNITDSLSDGGDHALLFMDLDDFKSINDNLGHTAGDELLRKIAKALRSCIRKTDLAGRVGGDEFVIFLKWISSKEDAAKCAQTICDTISQISLNEAPDFAISCSIGVAFAPNHGSDYQTLVKAADKKVYHAKLNGKGQFSI